jgi:hypothetical protein
VKALGANSSGKLADQGAGRLTALDERIGNLLKPMEGCAGESLGISGESSERWG